MAHFSPIPIALKATLYLLVLAFSVPFTNSARILEETAVLGNASNSIEAPSPASTQTTPDSGHTLSFFMHDILGGTNPSARAVTGIVTNAAVNGQLAFARPNGAVLPVNSGTTLTNTNNPITNNNNNNNIPFLTGLEGPNNGVPLINGPEKLLFGTLTVIDDEVTEGHEMGSAAVGKAQGFYVVSSEDGSSQAMAFTTMFDSGHYVDSINFFGVHRTGSSESHLAIMGGTGKYVNASGYATIQTVNPADNNQHETDGVETLLQFTVYLSSY